MAQDTARYRAWDRNNDGVVTRSEWRGTLQDFRALDINRDGVLSGIELRGENWEDDDNWSAETFLAIDRNRNGRITRGEWRNHGRDVAEFRRVDRNGDNHITRAEFMNANAGYDDDIVDEFDELDYDRTGGIEEDEWRGTRAAFNRLDVNRDGVISRREYSAAEVAVSSTDEFGRIDWNNNGVITRGEWRSEDGDFAAFDVNGDGVISRTEYARGLDRGMIDDTVFVDSRQPWTATNIYVNAGDLVTYQATGSIQMSTNVNDRATPAGSVTGRTAKNSPRPDQRAGGLLLRVGNGPVVFLGDSGSFTAQESGQLSLGVNDDHFPDNSGEYRVMITVRRR